MKYTAIYLESWVSGSHRHSLVKMCRIEKSNDETIDDMLEREGIKDDIQFLFVGHPQMVGEDEEREKQEEQEAQEDTESLCVVRGGSWLDRALLARAAFRDRGLPADRYDALGFRLAMTEDQEDTESPCMLRGGAWYYDQELLRGAARLYLTPHYRLGLIGFRLAQD